MKNRFKHLKPIDIGASIFLLGFAVSFGIWICTDHSDYPSRATVERFRATIAAGQADRPGEAPAADSTGAVLIPKQTAIWYLTVYLEATDRLKGQGLGIERQLRFVQGTDTTVITVPAIDRTRDREVLQFIAEHESTTVVSRESSFVFVARGDSLTTERTRCMESMIRQIPSWPPYGTDSVYTGGRCADQEVVF